LDKLAVEVSNFVKSFLENNKLNDFDEVSLFEFIEILIDLEGKFEKIRIISEVNLHLLISCCFKTKEALEIKLKETSIKEDLISINDNISDINKNSENFSIEDIMLIFFKCFEIFITKYDLETYFNLRKNIKKNNKKIKEDNTNNEYYLAKIFNYYEYLIPSSNFYNLKYSFLQILEEQKNNINPNNYSERLNTDKNQFIELFENFVRAILNKTYEDFISYINEKDKSNLNINDYFFDYLFFIVDIFQFLKIIYCNFFKVSSIAINQDKVIIRLISEFILNKFRIDSEIKNLLFCDKIETNEEKFSLENLENQILIAFGKNVSFANNQHSIYFFLNFSNQNIENNINCLKSYLNATLKNNKIEADDKIYNLLLLFSNNVAMIKIIFDFLFIALKRIVKEKINKAENNFTEKLKEKKEKKINLNFKKKYSSHHQFSILLIFEKFRNLYLNKHNIALFKLDKIFNENIIEEYKKCFTEAIENRYIFFAEAFNILFEKIYLCSSLYENAKNEDNNNLNIGKLIKLIYFKQNEPNESKLNYSWENVNSLKLLQNSEYEKILFSKAKIKIVKYIFLNLDLLFEYLDLIEDFTKFEEIYIKLLMIRSLENQNYFDIGLEKLIINQCIDITKNKFFHCYKLQTTINSIKLGNSMVGNFQFKIIGLPTHCINLYNLECNPVFSEKFNKIFEEEKLKANIPQNAKFKYQLGNIEFSIKTNRIYEKDSTPTKEKFNIKASFIQYEILTFISNFEKEILFSEITEIFNLTEDFAEFVLGSLIKLEFIIEKDNGNMKKFSFNKKFLRKNKNKDKLLEEYQNKNSLVDNEIEKAIFKEFNKIYFDESADKFYDMNSTNKFKTLIINLDEHDNLVFNFLNEESLRKGNSINNENIKEYFIDIQLNFIDYLEKNNNNAENQKKNINNIMDCYVVKACKQFKKCSLSQITQSIKLLNNSLLGDIEDSIINDRINCLMERLFIKKTEDNMYEIA